MNLKLRVTGLPDDVNNYVSAMKNAIPDNIISCSRPYPQTRYDKDAKEIAVYVTISGGDKK